MNEDSSKAMVVRSGSIADMRESAKTLLLSRSFPDVKSVEQALTKIMLGRQLGLDDASAMMGLFISGQGKLTMSANLMARLIKDFKGTDGKSKYRYEFVEKTNKACEIQVFERVDGEWIIHKVTERVSVEDFKHLMVGPNKANWEKYPKNMLVARCLSNVAKFYCADAFGGSPVYLPDELPDSKLQVNPETLEVEGVMEGEFTVVEENTTVKKMRQMIEEAGTTEEEVARKLGVDLKIIKEATSEVAEKVIRNLKPVVQL